MSLGTIQRVIYDCYTDCVSRTKRKVNLSGDVVYFMLDTCSIAERDGNTSYEKTYDAVNLICHRLCPGEWCTRTHCKNYSLHYAYHCNKTRPSVCKGYKIYIDKLLRIEKEKKVNNDNNKD